MHAFLAYLTEVASMTNGELPSRMNLILLYPGLENVEPLGRFTAST